MRAADPEALLEPVNDPALGGIATEVRERFERVLSSLSAATA
ncbi:hypothetical protein J2754_001282 [Halarchaeum solikamskense]|nr:hypothetical protein [Halarchaeum nitratireducens]MBP2250961.1 hypothetical protein [Halarchaeum solikamskense]